MYMPNGAVFFGVMGWSLADVAGIPNDFFPIAILLGTILGYFLPMLNGYCLQLHMLITGKQLDMVDEEILYTPADK